MNRQSTTVHIICLFTKQVEQLRVDHGNEEVKGCVSIRHDEEQCRFLVTQGIQLQFVIGSNITDFLNIKWSQTSAAGNQDGFCGFTRSQLILLVLTDSEVLRLLLLQTLKHDVHRVLEIFHVLTGFHGIEHINQGAEIEMETVTEIRDNGESKTVVTEEGEHEAKAVIIATGVKHRQTGLPNENELVGAGISYCAVCDGAFYAGQNVAMIGGGNSALQEALLLSEVCSKVTVVQNLADFTGEKKLAEALLEKENVEVHFSTLVDGYEQENGSLTGLRLRNDITGEVSRIRVDGGIYAEYISNHKLWEGIADYCAEEGLGVQMHLGCTNAEAEECLDRTGLSRVELLSCHRLFAVPTTAAGCACMTELDRKLLGKHKVYINPAHILALPPNGNFSGIEEIVNDQQPSANAIYDLFGRKVETPQKAKLYIMNGKKIIL